LISLQNLLKLQWGYVFSGFAYNLVSFLVVRSGGQQLSTTAPLLGGPVMLIYGAFILPAYFNRLQLYRFFMFCAILVFGWGGILVHIINYARDPSLYASFYAWALAVGINVFGLGLSSLALLRKYTH